jgi:hypothetical protein
MVWVAQRLELLDDGELAFVTEQFAEPRMREAKIHLKTLIVNSFFYNISLINRQNFRNDRTGSALTQVTSTMSKALKLF